MSITIKDWILYFGMTVMILFINNLLRYKFHDLHDVLAGGAMAYLEASIFLKAAYFISKKFSQRKGQSRSNIVIEITRK